MVMPDPITGQGDNRTEENNMGFPQYPLHNDIGVDVLLNGLQKPPETVFEHLLNVADVLQYLGRVEDARLVLLSASICSALGLRTPEELEAYYKKTTDKITDDLHPTMTRREYELLEAVHSINDHAMEFGAIEDFETMVLRMESKARQAIEKYEQG